MAWAMMAAGNRSRWRPNEIASVRRRDVKVGQGKQHPLVPSNQGALPLGTMPTSFSRAGGDCAAAVIARPRHGRRLLNPLPCSKREGFAMSEALFLRQLVYTLVGSTFRLPAASVTSALESARRTIAHTFRASTCGRSATVAWTQRPALTALSDFIATGLTAGSVLAVGRTIHTLLATLALATIDFTTPLGLAAIRLPLPSI